MLIFTCLLVVAAFTFHDLVPVYRNKQWKVFGIYAATMVLYMFVEILKSYNVAIPSPAVFIAKLVTLVLGQHQQ